MSKLPGFYDEDLKEMSTGAWATVTCYAAAEAVTAGTGYTGCATEYALLRALWDDITFTTTTITAGGLTATKIPDLLFAYEANLSDTDTWDDLAEFFTGVDGTEWSAGDFEREDFAEIFCTDGALNDAADVAVSASFHAETGDFDMESMT